MILTKKFRLVFKDNLIINSDCLIEQTGKTYPGWDIQYYESDNLIDIQQFILNKNLILPNI